MFQKPLCSPDSSSRQPDTEISLLLKASVQFLLSLITSFLTWECVLKLKKTIFSIKNSYTYRGRFRARSVTLKKKNSWKTSRTMETTSGWGKRNFQQAAVVRPNCGDVQIIQGQPGLQAQTDGNISRQSKMRGRNMSASTPKKDDAIKLWHYRKRWK